jgi:hypothetical protein
VRFQIAAADCAIAAGQAEASIVHGDSTCVAFMDIMLSQAPLQAAAPEFERAEQQNVSCAK